MQKTTQKKKERKQQQQQPQQQKLSAVVSLKNENRKSKIVNIQRYKLVSLIWEGRVACDGG